MNTFCLSLSSLSWLHTELCLIPPANHTLFHELTCPQVLKEVATDPQVCGGGRLQGIQQQNRMPAIYTVFPLISITTLLYGSPNLCSGSRLWWDASKGIYSWPRMTLNQIHGFPKEKQVGINPICGHTFMLSAMHACMHVPSTVVGMEGV